MHLLKPSSLEAVQEQLQDNMCIVDGVDVIVVLAPFPNNPNPVDEFDVVVDFDLKGGGLVWYARPQLFSKSPFAVMENSNTRQATRICPPCISAHLSQSI